MRCLLSGNDFCGGGRSGGLPRPRTIISPGEINGARVQRSIYRRPGLNYRISIIGNFISSLSLTNQTWIHKRIIKNHINHSLASHSSRSLPLHDPICLLTSVITIIKRQNHKPFHHPFGFRTDEITDAIISPRPPATSSPCLLQLSGSVNSDNYTTVYPSPLGLLPIPHLQPK